jgi:hypothetical protein
MVRPTIENVSISNKNDKVGGPGPQESPKRESTAPQDGAVPYVLTRVPVALALPTVRVEFSLLTKGDQQFVAYYSPTSVMTVAQRTLGNSTWRFKELPSKIGWDNHNWVILGFDEANCLHVSGNMHASPLVYFKATNPLDIDSLVKVRAMVGVAQGDMEYQMTYPLFLNTPDGSLVYYYRHGMSMSGGTLVNIYNATSRTWRRLHGDGLLLTGMADPLHYTVTDRNPYTSLRRGPDGRYHLIWLWRDNADASTCHHLCYARSPDMRSWETADGRPLATPFTFNDTDQAEPTPPSSPTRARTAFFPPSLSPKPPSPSAHSSPLRTRERHFPPRLPPPAPRFPGHTLTLPLLPVAA